MSPSNIDCNDVAFYLEDRLAGQQLQMHTRALQTSSRYHSEKLV